METEKQTKCILCYLCTYPRPSPTKCITSGDSTIPSPSSWYSSALGIPT